MDRWTHMCLSRVRGQGQPTGHPPTEQTLVDWGKGQGKEGSQEGAACAKAWGVERSVPHMGHLQELSERPLRMGRTQVSAPRPSQGDCPVPTQGGFQSQPHHVLPSKHPSANVKWHRRHEEQYDSCSKMEQNYHLIQPTTSGDDTQRK